MYCGFKPVSPKFKRVLALPCLPFFHPLFCARFLQKWDQFLEHPLHVADDRYVDSDVLADLGWIDVDVNDLRVGREARDFARYAVVEARPDRDEEV